MTYFSPIQKAKVLALKWHWWLSFTDICVIRHDVYSANELELDLAILLLSHNRLIQLCHSNLLCKKWVVSMLNLNLLYLEFCIESRGQ